MKVSQLSTRNRQELNDVLNLLQQKTDEHQYFDVIKVLFEMKDEFKDDEDFYPVLVTMIDQTKDMWKTHMANRK
jgi:hypothetical protein